MLGTYNLQEKQKEMGSFPTTENVHNFLYVTKIQRDGPAWHTFRVLFDDLQLQMLGKESPPEHLAPDTPTLVKPTCTSEDTTTT